MYPTRQMEKYNSEGKLLRRFERGITRSVTNFCETSQEKNIREKNIREHI